MRSLKLSLKIDDIVGPFKEGLPVYNEFLESEEVRNKFTSEEFLAMKKNLENFGCSLERFEQIQRQVKFSAPIPSEFKMLLPSDCYCILFHSKDNSFILPDCTGIACKSVQTFDWNGVAYNKISFIGIPLTPNLYLEIRNCDIFGKGRNFLYNPNEEETNAINQKILEFSYSQVLLVDQNQQNKLPSNENPF